MSNAARYRKKAVEFEQLKQIDRAMACYVKAIEEAEAAAEEIDVALYNKLGDLALRQGRVPDAVTYFECAVEHYANTGRFNNALALCNKILRHAPERVHVHFTLGRICARKGLRGDATRNFLAYASCMQQEGRMEDGIRALAEVVDIMPELNDLGAMVEALAARSGVNLPRRRIPPRTDRAPTPVLREQTSPDLVFLEIDYGAPTCLPYRLDPHDHILPGELPPLLLGDDTGNSGSEHSAVTDASVALAVETVSVEAMERDDAPVHGNGVEKTARTVVPSSCPADGTPSLPIAAVADAAATVASACRVSLREAVARRPKHWLLRRQLAEALFEAGQREAALHELEMTLFGLLQDGEFGAASDVADQLIRVSPDRVIYHQKRVELAVRIRDQRRLRTAYLDLADALVGLAEEERARSVYARVLEFAPYDERARAALGAALGAAVPPPPLVARPDHEPIADRTEWPRDDGTLADTRLRLREPDISGDEQADFDALLRHLTERVSRTLGEDDFESQYDFGVA